MTSFVYDCCALCGQRRG